MNLPKWLELEKWRKFKETSEQVMLSKQDFLFTIIKWYKEFSRFLFSFKKKLIKKLWKIIWGDVFLCIFWEDIYFFVCLHPHSYPQLFVFFFFFFILAR